MKKCPFCAELIQEEAILCRFCGKDLPKSVQDSYLENPGYFSEKDMETYGELWAQSFETFDMKPVVKASEFFDPFFRGFLVELFTLFIKNKFLNDSQIHTLSKQASGKVMQCSMLSFTVGAENAAGAIDDKTLALALVCFSRSLLNFSWLWIESALQNRLINQKKANEWKEKVEKNIHIAAFKTANYGYFYNSELQRKYVNGGKTPFQKGLIYLKETS